MLPLGSIFFALIVAPLKCGFLKMWKRTLIVERLAYRYKYQHAQDVCPFIAYCVTELETVFHSLIF